jgi:hypothetical protein
LLSVSLVTRVASAWSLSHFSIFWSHLVSIANESTTSTTVTEGEQGVVGSKQRSFALLCIRSFVSLSYTNQCP